MSNETVITTPLPAGTSEASLLASLQDHNTYIRTTCPQLISQKHISGTPTPTTTPTSTGSEEPCVYEITDKRPIGQTTFKMTLTNVAEGVDAVVEGRAPTGAMVVRSRWRVRAGAGTLEEAVEIESNLVTRKFIKGNVEKDHPEFHQSFIAAAAAK